MPFIKNRTRASLSAITAILGLIISATVMPVSGDTTKSFAGGPATAPQSRFADDPLITSGVCQQEKFALFEGPNIGDIAADTSCPSVISAIRNVYLNGGKP